MKSRRVFILGAVVIWSAWLAAQRGGDPGQILPLARAGRTAEAWQLWSAQPKNVGTLRIGIALAIETRQLQRGIDLYTDLATQERGPDRSALTDLALATAKDLATSHDPEVRLTACAAALALKPDHPSCRPVMDELTANNADGDERAWAIYSMADAGIRPKPADVSMAERSMSGPTRLRVAQSLTHLPAADRIAVLKPVLGDPDVSAQYQAVLVLGTIPGPEAMAALRQEAGAVLPTPIRNAVTIGLARHGDAASRQALAAMLGHLSPYEKAQAARALADASDKRGTDALRELVASQADVDRLAGAEALAAADPAAARAAIIDLLTTGSPAIRQRTLIIAGDMGLGTDHAVYRWLTDLAPLVRAAAIGAIRETFAKQDARRKPGAP